MTKGSSAAKKIEAVINGLPDELRHPVVVDFFPEPSLLGETNASRKERKKFYDVLFRFNILDRPRKVKMLCDHLEVPFRVEDMENPLLTKLLELFVPGLQLVVKKPKGLMNPWAMDISLLLFAEIQLMIRRGKAKSGRDACYVLAEHPFWLRQLDRTAKKRTGDFQIDRKENLYKRYLKTGNDPLARFALTFDLKYAKPDHDERVIELLTILASHAAEFYWARTGIAAPIYKVNK